MIRRGRLGWSFVVRSGFNSFGVGVFAVARGGGYWLLRWSLFVGCGFYWARSFPFSSFGVGGSLISVGSGRSV